MRSFELAGSRTSRSSLPPRPGGCYFWGKKSIPLVSIIHHVRPLIKQQNKGLAPQGTHLAPSAPRLRYRRAAGSGRLSKPFFSELSRAGLQPVRRAPNVTLDSPSIHL